MLKINILKERDKVHYLQELDKNRYPESEYYIRECSDEDIIWDIVVVFDNIKDTTHVKVKEGGLIFISGEPPASDVYPRAFLRQFDYIVTSDKKAKHHNLILSQQALSWYYDRNYQTGEHKYDYAYLKRMPVPDKKYNISVISSSKTMMPGHNRRMRLLKFLKSEYNSKIDFYGNGFSNIEYKEDALDNYRFHICIENSSVPHYWSEKFADPLLGYSVPIYIGCPNIDEYFYGKGYFKADIRNFNEVKKLIDYILEDPINLYNRILPDLKKSRDLLLDTYNIFEVINTIFLNNVVKDYGIDRCVVERTIHPRQVYHSFKLMLYMLRIYRLSYKIILNVKYLILDIFSQKRDK